MYKKLLSVFVLLVCLISCAGCGSELPTPPAVDGTAEYSAEPVSEQPKTVPPVTDPSTESTAFPVTEPVSDEPVTDGKEILMTEDQFIDVLKNILINSKTVEGLNAAIAAADADERVSLIRTQQFRKGPILTEGELVDGVIAFVQFDDGLWVECEYPDILLSSKEYAIYETSTFLSAMERMLKEAGTIAEFKAALKEYDVYNWIIEIEVYRSSDNNIPIDENSVTDSLEARVRVIYKNGTFQNKTAVLELNKTNG